MHGELDRLIKFITEHYHFDAQNFPELEGKSEKQVFAFAVQHSALHFAKTAGKVVAVTEDADHGKEIDVEELKANIPKALINTLRLAELVHMSEQEIIESIEQKYNDKM